jgi:hypothetical protein|tara:strand:- start:13080 stop:13367 length:288 start_codon:yes stop_codon:yes gene_type:complete
MTWDEIKNKKTQPIPTKSIDGYIRTAEDEQKLNKHFASLFKGEEGKKVLDYLKSITTETVAGPNITSNGLFHIEGMRFLMGVITTRIKKGENDGR